MLQILFLTFVLIVGLHAQDLNLPASLTEEEQLRLDEIGGLRDVTPPPVGEFNLLAEYNDADGVIFAWSNSYSILIRQLITAVSLSDTAYVVVANSSTQANVNSLLSSSGADMSRVQFIIESLNSVWMRDYGPWWGLDEYGQRGIVDFIYNRPRPLDDVFPQALAEIWELPYYGPDLIHPGGNFIVDGHGRAFATTLIQAENSSYSYTEISDIFADYGGIDTLILLTPMQYDGTGHIDMFCKLLNDSTFIVGEYATPGDGAGDNYNILNQNATLLANLTSVTGRPFLVERMLMPPYNSGISYTYTNSLIINNLVLVPIYGFATDAAALAQYQAIMPDYDVLGFDCNAIIPANGAIHCITKLAMSNQPVDCIPGDLNLDTQTNIQDLVILVNLILGQMVQTPELVCAGDLNENGDLSVQDIILLVQVILN
ncbi:MAG: agmatine deiminase family protein [Candidatus Marinimicrobia bacterium]|nr:agmatine deiminase family protein [Candidatus Neomarinimicrobiota bacterium]